MMESARLYREGKLLDDAAIAALVAKVRASAARAASASLRRLAAALPEPIVSMSLRAWPLDFPTDIAVQRRAPYEWIGAAGTPGSTSSIRRRSTTRWSADAVTAAAQPR